MPEMTETPKAANFVRAAVTEDLELGRFTRPIVTRFPPEPNGYLHIGHAKAISLDFGIAEEFGGHCNLRFDDTNPTKESQEYVDAIMRDIRWLGFDWGTHLYHASDYFEQLYQWAVQLIKAGKAYVDDLTAEEMRETRGTLTEPGRESPHRNRSVDENLTLFERMRRGEFEDGAKTLRAKIDMGSPNLNLRDPVMYRIRKTTHQRTGDAWCIYPIYDWAHGQSDSIEHVTHSLCSLEYEDHRPLYDWYLEALGVSHPRQIEFARLNLSHTMMSKRKLLTLVEQGHVRGWDDPRMPTLAGLRRRGYTPESIRDFAERIGVTKAANLIELATLEHAVREDLNKRAPAPHGGAPPAEAGGRELSGRPGRGVRGGQQPGGPGGRHPQGHLQPRPLHRAGRLPRSAAAEIFPHVTRRRSPPARRVHREVHRRGTRWGGQRHRGALHVRPGDARR